jgi:cytoskeletal protein RodZ
MMLAIFSVTITNILSHNSSNDYVTKILHSQLILTYVNTFIMLIMISSSIIEAWFGVNLFCNSLKKINKLFEEEPDESVESVESDEPTETEEKETEETEEKETEEKETEETEEKETEETETEEKETEETELIQKNYVNSVEYTNSYVKSKYIKDDTNFNDKDDTNTTTKSKFNFNFLEGEINVI